MLIKVDGLLCRILMRVPMRYSPFWLMPARVGMDCRTYCRIEWGK